MATRHRLPAFGKALIAQREAGEYPGRVWVIVGEDWGRRPKREPSVCVKPDATLPRVDWSVLAGLPVGVVVRTDDVGAVTAALVGIAAVAAPVTVHWVQGEDDWPYVDGGRYKLDAGPWLWASRQRGQWPEGWSDALHEDYAERKRVFRCLVFEDATGEALDAAA